MLANICLKAYFKTVFFPPSSLASFQEYLPPNDPFEYNSPRFSSYSRPIGGAWNSPELERKRQSMLIKLAHCIQTDSRRRNRTQQEDENGSKAQYFALVSLIGSISSAARTQACSAPLLLLLLWDIAGFSGQRLEVEVWGDGVIDTQSMQIPCPNENARAAFSNFSTLRLGLWLCATTIYFVSNHLVWFSIVYLSSVKSNTLHYSTQHGCRQEICFCNKSRREM